MASNDLRLQVLLDIRDKASAVLGRIKGSSTDAARTLQAARQRLKELDAQQKAIGEMRTLQDGLTQTATQLKVARARVDELRHAHVADGKAARAHARELAAGERVVARLTAAHRKQFEQLGPLRDRLRNLGVRHLAQDEARLQTEMAATNKVIAEQRAQLKALGDQHARLDTLKKRHAREMLHVGMLGAGAAASVGAGRALVRPLRATVDAFAPQEDATTQLRASMMTSDGSVAREFEQIQALATRLGDRLPGTTADFQDMMTMLRRQGISAQAILGGLGEASAYLGVQLRMPVTEAAEFGAKMQDATRTTEADMMALMDVIQRTYYLGVDPSNMLQGFARMSPVLGVIRKEGLAASRELAPLLVVMDQTGMAGEAAGNAIRKVYQAGFDMKKLGKANDALAGFKAGFTLDFTDGQGEFGGTDKLFEQLARLKTLDSVKRTTVIKTLFGDDAETLQVLNTLMDKGLDGYREVQAKLQAQADLRTRVNEQLKTLTNTAEAAQGSFTNLLADIGATVAPDLKRLIAWLGELASATGAWVRANPQLVSILFKLAAGITALLVVLGTLGLGLAAVLGPTLLLRFALARLGLGLAPLLGCLRGASQGAGLLSRAWGALTGAARTGLGWLKAAPAALARLVTAAAPFGKGLLMAVAGPLKLLGQGLLWIGRLLAFTPWGRAAALAIAAATLIYTRWDAIKAGAVALWQDASDQVARIWTGARDLLRSIWDSLGGSFPAVLQRIGSAILAWSPLGLFTTAFASLLQWFDLELPARFTDAGRRLLDGLVAGITGGLGKVHDAITGVADQTVAWFREKLGIRSPSRVFIQAGGHVAEGAALGIERGLGDVRRAALGLATAAAVAGPLQAPALAATSAVPLAQAQALRIDRRPPLQSPGAAAGTRPAGSLVVHNNITIHAAPGMDAQAIARAVSAELERRERAARSRHLSALGDIS